MYRFNKKMQHRALKWFRWLNNVMCLLGYGVFVLYLSDLIFGSNFLSDILL